MQVCRMGLDFAFIAAQTSLFDIPDRPHSVPLPSTLLQDITQLLAQEATVELWSEWLVSEMKQIQFFFPDADNTYSTAPFWQIIYLLTSERKVVPKLRVISSTTSYSSGPSSVLMYSRNLLQCKQKPSGA